MSLFIPSCIYIYIYIYTHLFTLHDQLKGLFYHQILHLDLEGVGKLPSTILLKGAVYVHEKNVWSVHQRKQPDQQCQQLWSKWVNIFSTSKETMDISLYR